MSGPLSEVVVAVPFAHHDHAFCVDQIEEVSGVIPNRGAPTHVQNLLGVRGRDGILSRIAAAEDTKALPRDEDNTIREGVAVIGEVAEHPAVEL